MGDAFLQRLGLTAKEARAYRELLRTDGLDARALSARMGDTYPAIYRTLAGLESKGWVARTDGRPRRFHARPPAVLAEALRGARLSEVQGDVDALAALASRGGPVDADPRVFKGLSASLAALAALIRDTDKDVFCVSTGSLDRELIRMVLRHLSRARGSAEWYLSVASRDDLGALRSAQGPNVRALAVIPRMRATATRLDHLFAFGGDTQMLTLNAWYREGRLDREGTHAVRLADAEVVRVQLEALVLSTRALAGRPVAVP